MRPAYCWTGSTQVKRAFLGVHLEAGDTSQMLQLVPASGLGTSCSKVRANDKARIPASREATTKICERGRRGIHIVRLELGFAPRHPDWAGRPDAAHTPTQVKRYCAFRCTG